MTTRISADIHFGPADLRHKYHPADDKCHAYGVLKINSGDTTGANLYFDDAAHVRAAIAELALLAAEMDPPVLTGCGEVGPDGYLCGSHEDGHHVARTPQGEMCARWPLAAAPDRSRRCEKCLYLFSAPSHDEMCAQRAAYLASTGSASVMAEPAGGAA